MNTEQLELVNYCQHRHRVLNFGTGLIAVLGPCGSGKSNIFGAIRFAATGEQSTAGVKSDDICQLAPKDEKSYVKWTFTHAGTRGVVQRNLRGDSTSTLRIDGAAKAITGDKKINAELAQILGPAYYALNEVVIISQRDIFGFLDRTPAKRAELFQRLFRTEAAEVVYKILTKQAGRITIPSTGVTADSVRQRIEETQAQLQSLRTTASTLLSYQQLQTQRDAAATAVQNYTTAMRYQQAIEADERSLAEIDTQLTAATDRHTKTSSDLATLETARDAGQAASESAKAVLANLANYMQVEQSRERIRTQRATCVTAQQQLVEPQPPADYSPVEVLQEEINRLTPIMTADAKLLQSFADGKPECPTCHTPTTSLTHLLEEAKARLDTMQATMRQLRQRLNDAGNYETQQRTFLRERERLATAVTQWDQQEASLQTVTADTSVPKEQLEQTVTQQQEFEHAIGEYRRAISGHEAELARLRGRRETLVSSSARNTASLATVTMVTDAEAAGAREQITYLDGLLAQRRQIDQDIAVAERTIQELQTQLQQILDVEQRSAANRAYLDFNAQMRDLVHVHGIPRFVSQRNLERLQAEINRMLEIFQADFRVAAAEGLSYTAHKSNGVVLDAGRLSIGQQAILATTFTLATNLMFAENIGALYLDEPTAYLDTTFLRGFEPVLARLREVTASRGMQLIIITHERALAPLFDSVVQL